LTGTLPAPYIPSNAEILRSNNRERVTPDATTKESRTCETTDHSLFVRRLKIMSLLDSVIFSYIQERDVKLLPKKSGGLSLDYDAKAKVNNSGDYDAC